jgi:hypothetical protein
VPDPFPAVAEAAATGVTAELFADVGTTVDRIGDASSG